MHKIRSEMCYRRAQHMDFIALPRTGVALPDSEEKIKEEETGQGALVTLCCLLPLTPRALLILVIHHDCLTVHVEWLAPTRRRRDVAVTVCVVVEVVVCAGVDANIVVRELAHLCIINAEYFCLFGGAQTHAGDEMHNPEDYSLRVRINKVRENV